MNVPTAQIPLTPAERRQALGWGHVNGALWSIGNGLTTGPLVYFLAIDLGAQGRQIGWLFAAPSLAGLLRLAAPAVIRWAGSAKRACLGVLLTSYFLIFGLPLCGVAPHWLPRQTALAALVTLLCVHQLLEYIGTVALWTWLGDLVPLPIRGRYFARRQMIQLAVLIPTLLAGGYFADRWRAWHAGEPNLMLLGYAIPNALGAACLLGCLAPLVKMPSTPLEMRTKAIAWRAMLAPFADAPFRRVLWFRVWLSLSNGISKRVTRRERNDGPGEVPRLSVDPEKRDLAEDLGHNSFQFWHLAGRERFPHILGLGHRFGVKPVWWASHGLALGLC